ncbi:MAG: sulfur oxidation c-type cytochrome SoxX [Burkholderiales bacterium]
MPSFLHTGVITLICLLPLSLSGADAPQGMSGRELAFSTAKGNCLACHQMPSDPTAQTSANIGPPLIGMKARFPDRARLRAQIWDATAFNQDTVMPPFGKHKVLTEDEIDKIVDYVAGL